jgi:peroxiredoxin
VNRNVVVIVVVILVVTGMLVAGKFLVRQPGPGVAALGNVKGQPAPDFELQDLDGRTVRLADLRGKAVLLNFWATWCPPCKVEIPWFIDLQKQYGAQGLQIVGVSMDDAGPDKVSKFAQQMGINYPVLMGNDKMADLYGGVQALPTTFYIGRDGKFVSRVYGLVSHGEVESNIRAALGQGRAMTASAGGK